MLSLKLFPSSLYRFVSHKIAKTLSTLPTVSCITVKTKALRRKGVDTHNNCLNDQNTLSYCRRLLTAKINFSSYGLKDIKMTCRCFSAEFAYCEADITFFAARHDEDTRQWLFKDFDKWFSDPGDSRAYVLLGDAGIGKSVIAGALTQRARNKGHLGAAYFCRHNDGTRNNPRYLVGTIARQLCDCNSEISTLVGGEDGVKMMLADSKLGVKELFTKLLEEPLGKCAPCQQRKLVIIDALDETEYESREDFLYVIKKALPRLPQWLLFFITSRAEHSVQSRLEKYKPCIRICAGDSEERGFYKQHEQDIKLFLEKDIDFSYISYSIEQVTKKCNGLFLYAYYIAEVLKESNSHRVSQQTDLFPGDIDEFFEENFQRVFDKVGADLYRKLFGCIIAAPSPLPISFISFVLNREKSNLDEQEAIDAVSLFVIRTSDETLEFLHNLIPTWLTDKKKASRKLLIDTEVAVEYLRMIFIDVLSAVVQETPATLSCRDENLERFVMHFAVRFLCHPNNQNSLTDVFSWLTCYPFLEKRIQSGRIEIYHLIEDFQLASSCIAVDETQKQKILREISLALEIDFHVLVECPHLFRSCVRNAPDAVQRQFSIPPVSAPGLEWSICEFLATQAVYKCTCFATASDKKTIAGASGHSLFFFDASTLETVSGPFDLNQYVTERIKHLEFSPDDKFVFFGRLDKWFSVGRGCVEDFPQFSGNTFHYDWGVVVPNGQHIVVKRSDHFSALLPTCERRICIVDLLSLWATKEIDRNPDKEWNCTHFSDVVADFPLGIETKCLLEYLGVNVEFARACALNVANDTSCYFCDKLEELRDPYEESSLASVRQHIIDIYPWIFPYQVWNLVTGRPLLQDVFCQSNVLDPFSSFCHVAFALMWNVDISFTGVGQVVSVRNVALVTALNAMYELRRKPHNFFHQLRFKKSELERQLKHLVRCDCFFNFPDMIMPFWVSPLKRWMFHHPSQFLIPVRVLLGHFGMMFMRYLRQGEIHLLQTGSQEQDSSNYSPEKRKHKIPIVNWLSFTYDDLHVVYLSSAGLLQALCLETGTVLTSVSGQNCFYFTREKQFGFLFRRDTEERFVFLTNLCDPFKFFRQQISVPGKTVAACFSSSDTVTTVSSKSMIISWRITDDKRGFFFNVIHSSSFENSSIQVLHIQHSPNGILVAFQQGTKIMECNIEESIKFPCVVYEGDFCSTDLYLTFSPDVRFLLFSIKDNFEGQFFYVWNVYTKTLSEKFTSPGLLTIDSFCLSSDNRNLILCGGECEIEIWEFSLHPLHLLKRICVERSFNPVKFSHCAVSQDSELLVCCLANVIFVHSLHVADIHSSKRVLRGHLGKIEFCKFLKRNRYLISYAVDGMVFLWDISESKALGFARIAKGREKILCMAVSPDEDRAVCFISPSRVCVLNFCNLKCALPADFFTAQRKSRIITAETSLLPVGQIPSTSNVQASRLKDDQHGGFRSPDLEEQFLLTPEDLLDSDESDDCLDYDDSD